VRRVSGCGFRVAGCGLRVAGFGLRVSGYGFKVLGYGGNCEIVKLRKEKLRNYESSKFQNFKNSKITMGVSQ